jgi:hypothetical protein
MAANTTFRAITARISQSAAVTRFSCRADYSLLRTAYTSSFFPVIWK